jgi:hypothetical protein
MNLPRFTGEASLYQTNGYYRTGSQVIHSSAEMVNRIYSAMEIGEVVPIIVPSETVVIIGEAPPGVHLATLKLAGSACWRGHRRAACLATHPVAEVSRAACLATHPVAVVGRVATVNPSTYRRRQKRWVHDGTETVISPTARNG